MRQFKCRSCGKLSNFAQDRRKMRLIIEMKTSLSFSNDETRTYTCQHCDEENDITQPEGAWVLIDSKGQ